MDVDLTIDTNDPMDVRLVLDTFTYATIKEMVHKGLATQMAIELFRLDPDHETTKNKAIMEFYYKAALKIIERTDDAT